MWCGMDTCTEGGWHWAESFFLQAAEEISQVGAGNGKWFSFLLATVVADTESNNQPPGYLEQSGDIGGSLS